MNFVFFYFNLLILHCYTSCFGKSLLLQLTITPQCLVSPSQHLCTSTMNGRKKSQHVLSHFSTTQTLKWRRVQRTKQMADIQTWRRTHPLQRIVLVHRDSRFELGLRFSLLLAVVDLLPTLCFVRRCHVSVAFLLYAQQLCVCNKQ